MRVYHFSEQPYDAAWGEPTDSLRVTFPNRHCDPAIASRLLNERLDEWVLCDELGLDIMVNEHHSSATCLSASATIPLAMLARQTKRARLLGLGFPIAMRTDPVRLAEEIAYIDVVSGGRLDIGFPKGAPYEVLPGERQPRQDHRTVLGRARPGAQGAHPPRRARSAGRASSTSTGRSTSGPGRSRTRRPSSSPAAASARRTRSPSAATPSSPSWAAGTPRSSSTPTASGPARWAARCDQSRFGYCALVGVGRTEEEGHRRVQEIAGYFRTTSIVGEAFMNPPGYMPPAANAQWLRRNQTRGRAGAHFPATTRDGRRLNIGSGAGTGTGVAAQDMIDAAVAFAGTPDQVYDQIVEFLAHSGGVGNLMIMGQGGELSHTDACENLTLFAQEVLPRLQALDQSEFAAHADERIELARTGDAVAARATS